MRQIIRETYPNVDGIDNVLDNFEDNYIGRTRRGRPRAQPKFPIALWNVMSRTEEDLPRTKQLKGDTTASVGSLTVLIQHCGNSWKTLRLRKV